MQCITDVIKYLTLNSGVYQSDISDYQFLFLHYFINKLIRHENHCINSVLHSCFLEIYTSVLCLLLSLIM